MNLTHIFIILLIIFMVWWPIGGLINWRRGKDWMNWLQNGMKEQGATSIIKWLRPFHSVGQLTVNDVQAPYRSFDVLFTLERRENIILYLLRHLQGRRDEMIVQSELVSEPVQELEVGYHGKKSYDMYLARQKDNPFTELGEQDGFRIARRGGEDEESIGRLRIFLANQGKVIQRMSLQCKPQGEGRFMSQYIDKNLLLRAAMTRMDSQSPTTFFAALRGWIANVKVDPVDTVHSVS
jgi:hypothetical protein